VGPSTGQEKND